jgi:Holliday junction resolvasome RuvABC endonuclease subunit
MKIKINKLEEILGYEIKKNYKSIGIDTASRSGVCIVTTNKTDVEFDWQFIEFPKTKGNDKYIAMGQEFADILEEGFDVCIVEDTHLKYFFIGKKRLPQVEVLKKLTRYGGIVLANAINNEIHFEIIGATPARSRFHINTAGYGKGNSKLAVADWLKNNLKLKLDDNDIADAIVLALLGVCEGMDFDPKKKPRKRK